MVVWFVRRRWFITDGGLVCQGRWFITDGGLVCQAGGGLVCHNNRWWFGLSGRGGL